MPLPPSLCDAFYEWGRPRLRPLLDARGEDAKAGVKRYGALHKLLEEYLEEFGHLPFAQPDFKDYLDDDGNVTETEAAIRYRARCWFRNHSRTSHTVQLAKFESDGGISEPSSTRVTSAAEMWADGEKARIRKATCEELGIPVTTGNKALPAEWIGVRKSVVKREFALLPQTNQDEWHNIARLEREANARDRGSVISIQERQMGFASWLDGTVSKKVKGHALGGVFYFTFHGYFVRADDKQLERFSCSTALTNERRGKVSSDPNAPSWFKTDQYNEIVSPAYLLVWEAASRYSDSADKVLFQLSRLPAGAKGEALKMHREELTQYFEEMFRLDCDFAVLDTEAFWEDVAKDPSKYVDPDRLPDDIVFAHPDAMTDIDFCEVYTHAWRCQNKGTSVERDARFIYEADAVREHVTRERVDTLRREQQRRARKAKAAKTGTSGATTGQGPASPTVNDPAVPGSAQQGDAPEGPTPAMRVEEALAPPSAEDDAPAESAVPRAPNEVLAPGDHPATPRRPVAEHGPVSPTSPRATRPGKDADATSSALSSRNGSVTPTTGTNEPAASQPSATPEAVPAKTCAAWPAARVANDEVEDDEGSAQAPPKKKAKTNSQAKKGVSGGGAARNRKSKPSASSGTAGSAEPVSDKTRAQRKARGTK
ncbi:hypothetical protein AURDEDRAFT_131280 [Auricularia subglabra TFB-10046 SS5]|uniref:Uncharacterized protein n=1 Tax=Auricularia subglabra (strain TFB-10046 / SS5) TaxID=717982 RepID=J0WP81_AURST|nr:hypothetical protein AURDEDRAFT_131280 [Auricularia subglabra TFB-10046 SS5]